MILVFFWKFMEFRFGTAKFSSDGGMLSHGLVPLSEFSEVFMFSWLAFKEI